MVVKNTKHPLFGLINWMTMIFIMNNYNGEHLHESNLLLFCWGFKSQSGSMGINKLWHPLTPVFCPCRKGIPCSERWQGVGSVQTLEALLNVKVNSTTSGDS